MAQPNIVNVTSITGETDIGTFTTTAAVLVANAASSGKVYKINTIIASNIDGTNDGAVTVSINSAAGGGGTSIELASTVTVPADATLVVIDKNSSFYLEEDKSITGLANAASTIEYVISYEVIN
jgi:hypothetical protein